MLLEYADLNTTKKEQRLVESYFFALLLEKSTFLTNPRNKAKIHDHPIEMP